MLQFSHKLHIMVLWLVIWCSGKISYFALQYVAWKTVFVEILLFSIDSFLINADMIPHNYFAFILFYHYLYNCIVAQINLIE